VTPVEKAHARLRDAHVKAGWTGVWSVESPKQFTVQAGGPVILRHWYGTHPTHGQEFQFAVEVIEPAPTRQPGLAPERWTEDET
jgi:hypothetical protein